MNYLTRYILSELLKVLVFALVAMTVVLLLGVVAVEAVKEGLGPSAIARLIPYSLPMALRFTVPGTILFAACTVFGRMSASNEIVAIKSLGVTPMVVVWPALLLGLVASGASVWMNDIAVTWGTAGINRVVLQSIEQVVYGRLKAQRSYSNQRGFAINVKEVRGKRLIMPTLSYQPPNGKGPIVITAKEAEMQLNSATSALLIIFTDMVVDGPDMKGVVPGRSEFEIPLSSASRKGRSEGAPTDLPMSQIEKAASEVTDEISLLEKGMAANAGFAMASADFAKLSQPSWQSQLNQLASLRSRLIRLRMEPWRRWATGFSCFFFVLIGVPAAIVLRNGDFLSSFGKCFGPIVLFYYPVLMLVLDQSKAGQWPAASVWIPNLALVGPGLWIMRRMLKN
jgi:lipopolysaccharide export system permease protein